MHFDKFPNMELLNRFFPKVFRYVEESYFWEMLKIVVFQWWFQMVLDNVILFCLMCTLICPCMNDNLLWKNFVENVSSFICLYLPTSPPSPQPNNQILLKQLRIFCWCSDKKMLLQRHGIWNAFGASKLPTH